MGSIFFLEGRTGRDFCLTEDDPAADKALLRLDNRRNKGV